MLDANKWEVRIWLHILAAILVDNDSKRICLPIPISTIEGSLGDKYSHSVCHRSTLSLWT